jgi:hypothetical protein
MSQWRRLSLGSVKGAGLDGEMFESEAWRRSHSFRTTRLTMTLDRLPRLKVPDGLMVQ